MEILTKANHLIGIRALRDTLLKNHSDLKTPSIKVRNNSTLVDLSARFSTIKRPSSSNVSIFREQFYTLILNATTKERQKISELIARSIYVPKAIIIFLAMEELAIAAPALLYSPLLQSPDLNIIIKKCSFEHAKIISRREDLDKSNVIALLNIDQKSSSLKLLLASNASLTSDPEINALLKEDNNTKWQDLPAKIVTTANTNITIQKQTGSKDLSNSLIKLANRGGKSLRKPTGKPTKSNFAPLTKKQIEQQLLTSSRQMDIEAVASSVEHFCGLNYQITYNLLHQENAGLLATLLCALEISDISAARILLLLNKNIGRNAQIFRVVMDKYKNLDQNECAMFFKKLGADFKPSQTNILEDVKTTRFALSLAARDRRAALLQQSKVDQKNSANERLRA